MSANHPLLPDIDFAYDDVPHLHELLDETRSHGSVVPVRFHGDVAWLINGYNELKAAFRDEKHFMSATFYQQAQEPAMGRTIQSMTGDEHRLHRALVQQPFLPIRIREYAEVAIEETIENLIDNLAKHDEIDLVHDFTRLLPFKVITRLLGVPSNDEDRMLAWVDKLFSYPWDPEGALQARAEVEDYFLPIIQDRRSVPADDLISLLTSVNLEGSQLTNKEILPFCLLLFPAGSDTTYKNLGSLLYILLSNPEIGEEVLKGEDTCNQLVEEGLRFEPPVALLPRTCSRSTELGGVQLTAGDSMLFGIAAANRDPTVFANPHKFEPGRMQKPLSFGHGLHLCLGQHLARLELNTAIRRLFERYPRMHLSSEQEVSITGGTLRGPGQLFVRMEA